MGVNYNNNNRRSRRGNLNRSRSRKRQPKQDSLPVENINKYKNFPIPPPPLTSIPCTSSPQRSSYLSKNVSKRKGAASKGRRSDVKDSLATFLADNDCKMILALSHHPTTMTIKEVDGKTEKDHRLVIMDRLRRHQPELMLVLLLLVMRPMISKLPTMFLGQNAVVVVEVVDVVCVVPHHYLMKQIVSIEVEEPSHVNNINDMIYSTIPILLTK